MRAVAQCLAASRAPRRTGLGIAGLDDRRDCCSSHPRSGVLPFILRGTTRGVNRAAFCNRYGCEMLHEFQMRPDSCGIRCTSSCQLQSQSRAHGAEPSQVRHRRQQRQLRQTQRQHQSPRTSNSGCGSMSDISSNNDGDISSKSKGHDNGNGSGTAAAAAERLRQ